MKVLFRLSKLILPLFPVMILAVLLGTAGFFCAIGIPVYGAAAILTRRALWVLLALGILRGVLHYAEQYCNHYIAFTLLARIRHVVFKKLRSLGAARLDGREKGALISLITSDIELLEVFYAHTISPVFIAILVSGASCAFLFRLHPLLSALALFFYILVALGVPLVFGKKSARAGEVHREKFASMNSFLLDSLRGITMSILYGTGPRRLGKMKSMSDALSESRGKLAKIEGISSAVSGIFVTAGAVSMLFASLHLSKTGAIGFESAIISTVLMFSSFGPALAVANLGAGLSQTVASGKRVLDLLDEKPAVQEIENGKTPEFSGAAAKNVTFSYSQTSADSVVKPHVAVAPLLETTKEEYENCVHGRTQNPSEFSKKTRHFANRQEVDESKCDFDELNHRVSELNHRSEPTISGVSMEFPRGKIVGIQGKSGSGKSTLLKLLMRFYEADSGAVEISNLDVREIDSAHLRKTESLVQQETVLFHDTIENNVRIAKLDATDEEIEEACRKAALHGFVQSLPNGYKTEVSELGDNFSGGERQRLGLARAFLHGSDFLLLDEPTSNLDSHNERIVIDAVRDSAKGKTVVIVSHRESTFAHAEKIYRLENGRKS